jgi:sec-independent protein translocase protein TatA
MFAPPHLLLFFDISGGELLVIMVVAFLVFGPKKLPEIARKLGRVMNEVKKATNDITREFKEETDGIKNEFISARDDIKTETEKVKQEMGRTKARILDQIDHTDKDIKADTTPAEKPDKPADPEDTNAK